MTDTLPIVGRWSTDGWSGVVRPSADLQETSTVVTLKHTIFFFLKEVRFVFEFLRSYVSEQVFLFDLFFSEERLAKELKETKDQLDDTKSRLNQRIMVWNKI